MLKVARRGIVAHRYRLVSTMVAVILGVGFMAGTLVLGDTVQKGFDEVFTDVYRDVDTVVRSSSTITSPFGRDRERIDAAVLPTVAGVDGVAAAEGQVQGRLRIIGKDDKPIGNPQGGPPTFGLNWFTAPELNGWRLDAGRPPEGADEVVLDRRTADAGGFSVGDEVRLAVAKGVLPFRVVGIARFGTLEDFSGAPAVLLATPTAQELVGEPGRYDWISVAARDGVDQETLRARVGAAVPDDVQVLTGRAFTVENQNLFAQFVEQFTWLLFGFGLIAMFVGMFIIYNTFTIIVAQRTRELALLRAVGAGRGQILRSVVAEAVVVGAVAAAVGLAFGVVVAIGLRALVRALGFELPTTALQIVPGRLVLPAALALVATVVSALVPAWRATHVPPVAALRDTAIDHTHRPVLRIGVSVVFLAVSGGFVARALTVDSELSVVWALTSAIPAFLAAFAVGPLYVTPLARLLGAPFARTRGITGRLARQNALRNPTRTSTTAVALTVGVGLISVIAVAGASLRTSVGQAIEQGVRADFVVTADSFLGLPPQVAADLRARPEVATTSSVRVGRATVDGDQLFLGAIEPDTVADVLDIEVLDGSLAELGLDGLAVPATLAAEKGWRVGTPVTVDTTQGEPRPWRIAAVYDSAFFARGSGIIMGRDAFEAAFPPVLQVDQQTYVVLRDGVTPEAGRAALAAVTDRTPTARLQDLEELKEAQGGAITRQLSFLYALLGLAVIIGVIGVVNTLLLSVHERTRELGLLRAVGTARRQVRSTVLQESVIIALLGTVIGLGIGLLFGWVMVNAVNVRIDTVYDVPVVQLAVFVGLAAVAGVLAGLLPARRAARLDVLRAIAVE
jgi:putative ABC transport system permease protein